MLGTTIIAAALTTGDTMSQTIRSSATAALGRTDETVAARGVDTRSPRTPRRPGARYFPVGYTGGSPARSPARARSRGWRR